jgi:hypothetical protein
MKLTKRTVLIAILALLAAALTILAIGWAYPNNCVNVFGTYQNCHPGS